MTELKEIIRHLIFGIIFTANFALVVFASINIYYLAKRKKEIDKEEDEAIAE